MPLTDEELQAAKGARYYGPFWGTFECGLCPAGMIAKVRGARFKLSPKGGFGYYRLSSSSREDARKAFGDLLRALGFWDGGKRNRGRAEDRYNEALFTERERIWDRLTKEKSDE